MADHTPRDAFFPVYPGLRLKDGRYTIRRKLGEGVYSATYLVEDAERKSAKYRAAKILTLEATSYNETGEMQELRFLKAIRACEDINSLPILRDDFFVDGPRGRHLCFVLDLLSTDVSSFRRQFPNQVLPPFWVKNIIALVLEGLEQLHDLNIIHTDIKPDNILFGDGVTEERVAKLLAAEDVKIEDEITIDGKSWPILGSQPIPHVFTPDTTPHDAELLGIHLIDLGQGQWAGKQPTVDDFSARSLRAPEVILKSSLGPKLDIWSIGCVTFELLVGRWLFDPEDGGDDWSFEDDHLAKMLEVTGESFSPLLEHARFRDQYFDEHGELLRVSREDLYPTSIENALRNYDVLPEDEVGPAAEFIRDCIHLDPMARPSAKELQLHPWLKGAFSC